MSHCLLVLGIHFQKEGRVNHFAPNATVLIPASVRDGPITDRGVIGFSGVGDAFHFVASAMSGACRGELYEVCRVGGESAAVRATCGAYVAIFARRLRGVSIQGRHLRARVDAAGGMKRRRESRRAAKLVCELRSDAGQCVL